MLGPTMLRVVGQQCCVRLHGPRQGEEGGGGGEFVGIT